MDYYSYICVSQGAKVIQLRLLSQAFVAKDKMVIFTNANETKGWSLLEYGSSRLVKLPALLLNYRHHGIQLNDLWHNGIGD
jgi:hypothetical protein